MKALRTAADTATILVGASLAAAIITGFLYGRESVYALEPLLVGLALTAFALQLLAETVRFAVTMHPPVDRAGSKTRR